MAFESRTGRAWRIDDLVGDGFEVLGALARQRGEFHAHRTLAVQTHRPHHRMQLASLHTGHQSHLGHGTSGPGDLRRITGNDLLPLELINRALGATALAIENHALQTLDEHFIGDACLHIELGVEWRLRGKTIPKRRRDEAGGVHHLRELDGSRAEAQNRAVVGIRRLAGRASGLLGGSDLAVIIRADVMHLPVSKRGRNGGHERVSGGILQGTLHGRSALGFDGDQEPLHALRRAHPGEFHLRRGSGADGRRRAETWFRQGGCLALDAGLQPHQRGGIAIAIHGLRVVADRAARHRQRLIFTADGVDGIPRG